MSTDVRKRKREKKSSKSRHHDGSNMYQSSQGRTGLIDQMRDNLSKFRNGTSAQSPSPSFLKVIVTKTGEGIQLGQATHAKQPIYDDWGQEIIRQQAANSNPYYRPSNSACSYQQPDTSASHRDFLEEVIKELDPKTSEPHASGISSEVTHELISMQPGGQLSASCQHIPMAPYQQPIHTYGHQNMSAEEAGYHQLLANNLPTGQQAKKAKIRISQAHRMGCKFCPTCGQTVQKVQKPIDLKALVENAVGNNYGCLSRTGNMHPIESSNSDSDEESNSESDDTSGQDE